MGVAKYLKEKFINNPYFLWVEVISMSVEEVSLYFLGGDTTQYFGLVPIDPRSSPTILIWASLLCQDRIMVTITCMLVVANVQSSVGDMIPKTSYFKMIDYFLLYSLNIIILVMVQK